MIFSLRAIRRSGYDHTAVVYKKEEVPGVADECMDFYSVAIGQFDVLFA
jgi:hypothetical protein